MNSKSTRREFLAAASAAGVLVGIGGLAGSVLQRPATRKLKILVLGGTGQTGPHLIREALDRGHEVTMFNRGNRSDNLFPEVECILGDREKADGLDSLRAEIDKGRRWDVAIDIWPHIPKLVEQAAALLTGGTDHYMFVSSVSAYATHAKPNADEDDEVGSAPDADDTEFTMELFGPFKAECENRVRKLFPERHTIFRPGLIVGPRDISFRGGYWPVRVRRGGEVLAPGTGDDAIQIIDGRDLTAFEVLCMEKNVAGTFNIVGPHPQNPLTMRSYLETCREATDSDATFVWADTEFLNKHEVHSWSNMPCWIPAEGEYAGFGSRSVEKAVKAGLEFRSLQETVRDTLKWFDGLAEEQRSRALRGAGLSPERESEVLATWHARTESESKSD